jgi:hypothetical protein
VKTTDDLPLQLVVAPHHKFPEGEYEQQLATCGEATRARDHIRTGRVIAHVVIHQDRDEMRQARGLRRVGRAGGGGHLDR